jgi:hypothetical protein
MESERVIIHFDPVNRTRSGVPVQLLLDGTNLHALRIRVKPFYKNLHGVPSTPLPKRTHGLLAIAGRDVTIWAVI